MILEIFLPSKIGNHQILPSHTVGFSIQDNEITAVCLNISRSKTIIENIYKELIEPGDEASFTQKAADAIKKIIPKIKKYREVRVTIPASIVVLKELTVPFLDTKKIRMIIEYEVEPMLPFTLDNAIIDFIILDQNKKENTSTILVIAARIQDLENTLNIYRTAGIEVTHLVVDLISLYGLYQQIPEYQEIKKGSAIIDIGPRITRLAFLQDGKFRLMRNIMRGTKSIAENISRESGVPLEKVLAHLEKNGVGKINDENYDKSLEKNLMNLFNEIQFTLNSFSLKLNFQEDVAQLLFLGPGAQLKGMVKYSTSVLQIPSDIFNAEKIFENKFIKNKVVPKPADWQDYIFALSCSLPNKDQAEFNLRRKSLALIPTALIKKQWLTAFLITTFMIALIGINGYLQISYLSKTAQSLEQKEIARLKKIFNSDSKALKKKLTLKTLIKDAEIYVSEKEAMWTPFSQQRLRPLEILQELTRLIDKKRFDVSIEEVQITTDNETPHIELTGYLRSKTGYHFQDFGIFQKSFNESKLLSLTEEIDPTLTDEKGVKFVAKLKPKED